MTILAYYPKNSHHQRYQVCQSNRQVSKFIVDNHDIDPAEVWRVNAPKRHALSESEFRELYRAPVGTPISTGLSIRDAVRFS